MHKTHAHTPLKKRLLLEIMGQVKCGDLFSLNIVHNASLERLFNSHETNLSFLPQL
jgi:hypothetical protein